MIDFRSEAGVREAFKTVAAWDPPAESGEQAAQVLTFEGSQPSRRRRSAWFTGAAAAVVLAVIAAVMVREPAEQFAASEGEWATMAPSPLDARFAPASLWTGDELIIWGGHDLAGEEYVDGAAYDPVTDTWRQMADFPFDHRRRDGVGVGEDGGWTTQGVPGVWFEDRAMFVVSNAEEPWAWDVVAYDPATDAWEVLDSARFDQAGDVPDLREGTTTVPVPSGLVSVDGDLNVFGWDPQRYEYGWATFDPSTTAWGPFTGIPDSGEMYGFLSPRPAPLVAQGYVVWLADRALGDDRPLGYAVDARTGEITTIEPPMEAMHIGIGDVASDGVVTGIVIHGAADRGDGASRPGASERFAVRLDPSTGQWAELDVPPSGANEARAFGRLIAAEDTTVLLGGIEWGVDFGGLQATPSQLALDPNSGRWHRLPDAPIDLSRADPIGVWTGQRFIVWGGATTSSDDNRVTVPLGDGAQYIP